MVPAPSSEFLLLQAALAGRYSLDRELGRGGMGVVFLARDVALDRLVAIKLLPPALAADGDLRRRFLVEARTAAGLSHPNIVPIHAVEEVGDLVFFVMGYVDGETLGEVVRREGTMAPADLMRVVQEVAWALGHAHARGVVHRDVKPDNILLERGGGRALVTDFGIAQVASRGTTPAGGVITGTPQYLSPEQAAGEAVDGRSDIYSLGVTAFLAACGRLPLQADTVAGYLAKHLHEVPPPVATLNPRLALRFAAAIDRCLRKAPADRFQTAEALGEEIQGSRGAIIQVPAHLQGFLREGVPAGAEIATALTAGAVSLTVLGTMFGFNDFSGIVFYPVASLMAMLAGARFGSVVLGARDLLRHGYGHAALRPVLQQEERAIAEAPRPARDWLAGPWGTLAAGVLKTGLAVWLLRSDTTWIAILGGAGAIGMPTWTIQRLWNQLQGGRSLWRRLLAGRFGRALFRVAGVGLGRPALLPAAGQPTELALGQAIDQLFEGLPSGVRRQFAEVPGVIERLQADAAALRSRGGAPGAAERLATTVAALEALRLDLLRLEAGVGSPNELTRDLAAARRIGEQVDAVREADRVLESTPAAG